MTQSRWKSKVLWVSILIQVYIIADIVGLWQAIGIEKSVVSTIIDSVLQLLVIVGIINNPTDAEKL